ncbi:MAG: pirin family protein [Candidatus Marinarcus sp.]|uniref:pirin family protein n=1 Tax=Candidatus Marinarcus sp. TaxID=3100987 RepID=UPI003AFFEED4
MLKKIRKENMFLSNLGWLESRFHFSFAEYRNFDNMNFGVLRVLNDDIVHPNSGFDMHPHNDMEIVSYVVNGAITHKDSMGNEETLTRGDVQYMSAGTGVVHSEYNNSSSEDLRLLQIWILPPVKAVKPIYGSKRFQPQERANQFLNVVSSQVGEGAIKIHQDVNIYVSELQKGKNLVFDIAQERQLYFVQIEGSSRVNETQLDFGDAMEISDEKTLNITALEDAHFLFIEMKKA